MVNTALNLVMKHSCHRSKKRDANPMSHTLGMAARATGLSKSTIYRAIKSGRISAGRSDTGDYAIDPAELHRVFPPLPAEEEDTRNSSAKRGATGVEPSDIALEKARLEAEVAASSLSPRCCASSLRRRARTAIIGAAKPSGWSCRHRRRSRRR